MLTAASIKTAAPGAVLRDKEVRGLHVRVLNQSSAYYLFYRTKSGRQRRPKLGAVGIMSLTQARDAARKILLAVSGGADPAGDTCDLRASPTVAELATKYLAEYAEVEKKASSCAKDRYMLATVVTPRWGARKVLEITDKDVFALRESMKGTRVHFNRTLSLLSKMFNLAEVPWHIRPKGSNPAKGVPRFPEKPRRRKMELREAIEIAALLRQAESQHPAGVAFLRLLILTGARSGEIATGRREWLSDGIMRHPRVKTGERDIYFSQAAMQIVKSLSPLDGTLTGIKSPHKLWSRIRREAGCPDLRMHDLRRSFASVALSMGYSLAQIGELLGHHSPQTTKGYAYLIDEHKVAAAERTSDAITARMLPQGISP